MAAYAASQVIVDGYVDDMTDMVQDLLLRESSPVWLTGDDSEKIALERKTLVAFGDAIVTTIKSRYTFYTDGCDA